MDVGSRVRFTNKSRHGDWEKGGQGTIERVLAIPPQNQRRLYIVTLDSGKSVWVTDTDVEQFEQLSLLDELCDYVPEIAPDGSVIG